MKKSTLYISDTAIRSLLYQKFGSHLGLDTYQPTEEECINKGVLIIPRELAQREVAEKRGDTSVDFISLWRMGESFDWSRNRTVVGRKGMEVFLDQSRTMRIFAVPATLSYAFWVWTRSLDIINLCVEDYLFWQHRYPKLQLMLNDVFPLEYDLHFDGCFDENSLEGKYTVGPYFIRRFGLTVDSWIFQTEELKLIKKIQMTIFDSTNVENITNLYINDSNYDEELANAVQLLRSNFYAIDSITLSENSVSVVGNFTDDFTGGQKVRFCSSPNNGEYTVVSSLYDGEKTHVFLMEPLMSISPTGYLCKE